MADMADMADIAELKAHTTIFEFVWLRIDNTKPRD